MVLEDFEGLLDQRVLPEIRDRALDDAVFFLIYAVVSQLHQHLVHHLLVLAMAEGSEDDFHSLPLPLLTLRCPELVEALEPQVVLTEGEWPHIVIPEDVCLECFEVLALHEELGNLGLHGHRVQVRDESVADVLLAL